MTLRIREAREADAAGVATLVRLSPDAVRTVIHARTAIVAVVEGDSHEGFIAFDAFDGAVHITQLAGSTPVLRRLLRSPMEFAQAEGMPIETLTRADDSGHVEALRACGFTDAGGGPRFGGTETRRLRWRSDELADGE
jgi:hypothetical protein